MPSIFVSHAGDDAALVEPFVTTILQLGLGVHEEQIFFSSRRKTGVPTGEDLSHYVRREVEASTLVIAIISPTFQMRPYCIAELGAAWGVSGKLFPVLIPGMARTDLEGVLPTILTRHLDESDTLDELGDRVHETMGTTLSAMSWGQRKAEWLAAVDGYVSQLKTPTVISEKEYERALADLEGARTALLQCSEERERLGQLVAQLKALKDLDGAEDILVPPDEREAFDHLLGAAKDALRELPWIVQDAIWYEFAQGAMPYAEAFDDDRRRAIDDALTDGYLVESSDDLIAPNDDVVDIARAIEAVNRLHAKLGETSEEFFEWFRREYGMSPDLKKKLVWEKLM